MGEDVTREMVGYRAAVAGSPSIGTKGFEVELDCGLDVGNRSSGYPRMAAVGDQLVFAWTMRDGEKSTVKTATARQ